MAIDENLQYETNQIFQTRNDDRKPHLWPNLGIHGPSLGRKTFYQQKELFRIINAFTTLNHIHALKFMMPKNVCKAMISP